MNRFKMDRRRFLGWGAAAAGALALSPALASARRLVGTKNTDTGQTRFLFVIAAKGGASIVDSLLPVARSEVSSPELADTLVAYPDEMIAQPAGSGIRAVRSTAVPTTLFFPDYDIADFVAQHKDDMAVMTVEDSSVSHDVAQERAVTGHNFDRGRTIMEAAAECYGAAMPLANCNLAQGGFIVSGKDDDIPVYARSQLISDPNTFALATHGYRGIQGTPGMSHMERARAVRAELEALSPQKARLDTSSLRQRYVDVRQRIGPELENADLITKLMLLQELPQGSLQDFGLESSPDIATLAEALPELDRDSLQAQAAIAYLLVRYGASCTVTIGFGDDPSTGADSRFLSAPIAYDFSHTAHAMTQAFMWSQTLKAVDGLIKLLKSQPYNDGSLWDASLVYIATDFGRTKTVPAGGLFQAGTGHDLHNGILLISPMLAGNRVYGGVDPETCRTYGFDLTTSAPTPGSTMSIGHVYSTIGQALGLKVPGQYDMSVVLR